MKLACSCFLSMIVISTFTGMVCADASRPAKKQIVKIFILAGQSNMEGKAKNSLLDHQATDPKTASLFAHLRDGDEWTRRDDVFIKFLNRHGKLTIGYGSPNRTGIELEFGHAMGEHFDEPILLIKTAWGGHSLVRNFRPPSAGLPKKEILQAELEKARKRIEKKKNKAPLPTMEDMKSGYGQSYRNMMEEVRSTLKNTDTLFPELKGHRPEIAGFVWFQGWNDMYGGQEEYAQNMKLFIKDVRNDLGAPNMPFVIGVMGQNQSKPAKGNMAIVKEAQLSMEKVPEFSGNVKAVKTDVLVDKAAEELYPKWRDNFEQWEKTGSDFGYHYMGSAIWFNRIGRAMGDAMLEMLKS